MDAVGDQLGHLAEASHHAQLTGVDDVDARQPPHHQRRDQQQPDVERVEAELEPLLELFEELVDVGRCLLPSFPGGLPRIVEGHGRSMGLGG